MVFRKYEKTFRIELDSIPIHGKATLTDFEIGKLLSGEVTITEKMDGANVGIYLDKNSITLQKRRGENDKSHYQYGFFEYWYKENWHKFMKFPRGIVIYLELLKCVHTIKYNKLPDWCLVFDIYDLDNHRYLSWNKVEEVCKIVGLKTVPHIFTGNIRNKNELIKYIPEKSAYGDIAEGIVVKNHSKQMRGKIVKPEFVKEVDESEHWRNKKLEFNEVI